MDVVGVTELGIEARNWKHSASGTGALAENLIRLIGALPGDANGSGIRLVDRGID